MLFLFLPKLLIKYLYIELKAGPTYLFLEHVIVYEEIYSVFMTLNTKRNGNTQMVPELGLE